MTKEIKTYINLLTGYDELTRWKICFFVGIMLERF